MIHSVFNCRETPQMSWFTPCSTAVKHLHDSLCVQLPWNTADVMIHSVFNCRETPQVIWKWSRDQLPPDTRTPLSKILEGMLRKPWLPLLLAHFEKHENLKKNAFLVKLRYTKKNCVKLFKHTALFHPFLVFNLRTLLKLQTCIMFLIRPNINARVFLVFNSPYCPLICCLIGLLTTTAVQLDAAL